MRGTGIWRPLQKEFLTLLVLIPTPYCTVHYKYFKIDFTSLSTVSVIRQCDPITVCAVISHGPVRCDNPVIHSIVNRRNVRTDVCATSRMSQKML